LQQNFKLSIYIIDNRRKMAGKAKPTIVAKKPSAVKKPSAAKKPSAKKPSAKKPTGAKFNLNKLMMLLVRGAPKKGKKMMGGYKMDRIKSLLDLIDPFIYNSRNRIKERCSILTDGARITLVDAVTSATDETNIKALSESLADISLDPGLTEQIVDINKPLALPVNNTQEHVTRIFDINYMIIVIALCKVRRVFVDNHTP